MHMSLFLNLTLCPNVPVQQSFMKRLGNCLPFNSKKLKATPEQVELAAKYIVDRFGIPTIVEEDEVRCCVCLFVSCGQAACY